MYCSFWTWWVYSHYFPLKKKMNNLKYKNEICENAYSLNCNTILKLRRENKMLEDTIKIFNVGQNNG